MNESLLLARVEREDGGGLRVLAPRIGFWSEPPHRGALLGAGSGIGRLAQLNRRYRLVLPEGAAGRVTAGLPRHRVTAVEHGQLLFTLAPVSAAEGPPSFDEDLAAFGHPTGTALPEGSRAVVAPTDGVFYGQPSPEAPPFVRAGQRIRRGQAVGLVEVMKTFNPIVYDGPGFPEEGEVIEIRAANAQEVRAGEILVVVRSLGPSGAAPEAAAATDPPET